MLFYIARAIGIGKSLWSDERIRLLAAYDEPYATFTEHISEAKLFDSASAAVEFTQRVYAADPVRPDGKPNRPLSAYFWEFVCVAQLEAELWPRNI